MAVQMTVPFFSGSIFFRSYVSTTVGARVKIRTPITTLKIYDRKKSTVVWPAMFFEPPEKITTQKKKVQLSDRWLK